MESVLRATFNWSSKCHSNTAFSIEVSKSIQIQIVPNIWWKWNKSNMVTQIFKSEIIDIRKNGAWGKHFVKFPYFHFSTGLNSQCSAEFDCFCRVCWSYLEKNCSQSWMSLMICGNGKQTNWYFSEDWRSHHDELELFFSNPLNWEVKVVWDDWLICYSGGNFQSFSTQNFLCTTTKSSVENFLSIVQLKPKWKIWSFWSFHFDINHF